jgi:hypothetical protein
MSEGQIVIENPNSIALDQAIGIATPAIYILNDTIKSKDSSGDRKQCVAYYFVLKSSSPPSCDDPRTESHRAACLHLCAHLLICN